MSRIGHVTRGIAVAGIVASAAALAPWFAGPVAAECTIIRPSAAVPFRVESAFTATVVGVVLVHDDQVEAAGEGDGFAWTVTLDVDRAYIGDVPGELAWNGHTLRHLTCNVDLLGEELAAGERLFVALEGPADAGSPVGRMLLWHRVDGEWRFDASALAQDATSGPSYPAAARRVTTTAGILELLAALPDTATAPADAGRSAWLLLTGALFVAAGWVGRRRLRA